MKKLTLLMAAVMVLGIAPLTLADERPEHFEGKPAPTLEQAVVNFSEYNVKLAELLAQETLTAQDLHEIHQLTYTLENALAKINEEFAGLANTLEAIHIASESNDPELLRVKGRAYLDTAGKVIE